MGEKTTYRDLLAEGGMAQGKRQRLPSCLPLTPSLSLSLLGQGRAEVFCEDPSPYLLCCGFPRGFLALLPKTISCLGSQRVLKGGSGPPDMKAVKPRQEDPEGLAGQVGCEGATRGRPLLPAPHSLGSPGRRAASLHSPWTARPSAAPHSLWADGQTDSGGQSLSLAWQLYFR